MRECKTKGGHKVILDGEGRLTKCGTIYTAAGGIRMVWDRTGKSWAREEYDLADLKTEKWDDKRSETN